MKNIYSACAVSFALSLTLTPAISFGAPAVTGVTGTINNGQSITINGSGFGTTGPNVILFDDFEKGANGNTLSSVVRPASVGQWEQHTEINPYYPTYSSSAAHSGTLALRQHWGSGGDNQEGARWVSADLPDNQKEMYISFWTYLPAGQNVPGASGSYGPNWKVWWLHSDPWPKDDFSTQIISNNPTEIDPLCWVDGTQDRACGGWVPFTLNKGRWLRWEAHLTGSSTSSGTIKMWYTDSGTARKTLVSTTGKTLDSGSSGWDVIHFPGFARYDTNSNTYYDDIYIAAGNGAQARVEIGDASTYTACKNLAVLTPTAWGASAITATVRAGSFTSGQAYLFVIDASGNASPGYSVTLGQATPVVPAPQLNLIR